MGLEQFYVALGFRAAMHTLSDDAHSPIEQAVSIFMKLERSNRPERR